jgi:hypothetical protein
MLKKKQQYIKNGNLGSNDYSKRCLSKHEWEVKWKNLGSDCFLNRGQICKKIACIRKYIITFQVTRSFTSTPGYARRALNPLVRQRQNI